MAGDPHYNDVSLLLHMDGVDGSTTFTDSSPASKAVTAYGNAKISTAQSKFGGASAYFDGNGDYLGAPASTNFGFGTADFTIEFWVCPASLPTNSAKVIYDQRYALSDKLPTLLTYTGGNVIYGTGGTDKITSNAGALAVGINTHIAVARSSGVTRLFVNGLLAGSAWTDATDYAISRPIIGGAGDFPSGPYNFNGYIDELRITKGVAHYTATFTPPTAPFPDRAPQLSGTVKNASNAPAARLIRAMREDTGAFVGEATSDAITGAYTINCKSTGAHTLSAYPAAGENLPALTLRGVVPV